VEFKVSADQEANLAGLRWVGFWFFPMAFFFLFICSFICSIVCFELRIFRAVYRQPTMWVIMLNST